MGYGEILGVLRDLSDSIINRQVLDGWAYLFLGIKSLIRGM